MLRHIDKKSILCDRLLFLLRHFLSFFRSFLDFVSIITFVFPFVFFFSVPVAMCVRFMLACIAFCFFCFVTSGTLLEHTRRPRRPDNREHTESTIPSDRISNGNRALRRCLFEVTMELKRQKKAEIDFHWHTPVCWHSDRSWSLSIDWIEEEKNRTTTWRRAAAAEEENKRENGTRRNRHIKTGNDNSTALQSPNESSSAHFWIDCNANIFHEWKLYFVSFILYYFFLFSRPLSLCLFADFELLNRHSTIRERKKKNLLLSVALATGTAFTFIIISWMNQLISIHCTKPCLFRFISFAHLFSPIFCRSVRIQCRVYSAAISAM